MKKGFESLVERLIDCYITVALLSPVQCIGKVEASHPSALLASSLSA